MRPTQRNVTSVMASFERMLLLLPLVLCLQSNPRFVSSYEGPPPPSVPTTLPRLHHHLPPTHNETLTASSILAVVSSF